MFDRFAFGLLLAIFAFGVPEGGFGSSWCWFILMTDLCRGGGSMVVDATVYDISEDLSGCIIRWCLWCLEMTKDG